MRLRYEEDEAIEVQMAPLIDCVFLLLIFFLVATTLKKIEKELPVELPESQAAIEVQTQEDLFTIGLDAAGQTYIKAEKVSLSMLRQQLQQAAAKDKSQRVRIDTDRATPAQYVVHVLDLCQFEGLTNVGIHTKRPPD